MAAPAVLDTVFGSALVGIILAAGLFGVFTAQVWLYFSKYPKDKLWLKLLVTGLWVLLAVQFALNIHMIYVYLIDDFGQFDKLASANWDWLLYVIFASISAIAVQFWFARKLFLFAKNPIIRWGLTTIIVILSLLQFGFGIGMIPPAYKLKLFLKFTSLTFGVDIWLGANVACDIIITVFMCYYLHTSRTGFKKTNKLINKLMMYSIQTGALTSITEIFCLATFTGSGFHFGHILVVFPLAGLYCTSLLANLHARTPSTPPDTIQSTANSIPNFIELGSSLRGNGSHVSKSTNQEQSVHVVSIPPARDALRGAALPSPDSVKGSDENV